jgi:hypothetical protein
MQSRVVRTVLTLTALAQCFAIPARAWNAHGHRVITLLALDGLPADAPAWLRDETTRKRIAFQSSEPDRWRGWQSLALQHEHKPEHFLDIEDLAQFGLTLETLPPLRYEYIRALAVSKHIHPELVTQPYDAEKDKDRTKEFPGCLPYGIIENYAKLQSAFNQVRVLEKLSDTDRAFQLQQARENAIYHMGVLSHYVGDTAQPLHTTRHYNGWVGDNPAGYTTSDRFHSYIDGGVLARHQLTYESLKPDMKYEAKLNSRDPWSDMLAYLKRSHARMERTYQLDKSGDLNGQPGKEFISECLRDGASTLAALYSAAWASAAPNEKQTADFVQFDERDPFARARALPAPATQTSQPAPASNP